MKVLYLVSAYPRHDGDVITPWLVETIRRLRDRGVEIEVLAPSYRGMGDQEIGGVRVHRFRYAPAGWETLTHDQTAPDRIRERPRFLGLVPGYVVAGALAAARLARGGDFDLIHVFWPMPHGLIGLAAKRASGVPVVSTFFGVELTWLEAQLGVLRPVVRAIIRGSAAVTVISTHTRDAVLRLAPGTSLEVVPFGAAVEMRRPRRVPSPAGASRGYRLLFVGRLVERKGVHVLLDALAVAGVGGDVTLRVVGDGPWRERLERRASELGLEGRVNFLGFVGEEALADELAGCDALVLPAVQDAKGDVEGLGVVLLEAGMYGKPVIASASGGIVDIVRDGETGLLVPSGDPGALAGAIRRLASDPALGRRLGEAGLARVTTSFSWDAVCGRLERLYRRVARTGSGGRHTGSPRPPAV